MPSSIVMKFKDGVYAIDSDPSTPGSGDKNILSWQVSCSCPRMHLMPWLSVCKTGNHARKVLDFERGRIRSSYANIRITRNPREGQPSRGLPFCKGGISSIVFDFDIQ